MNCILIFPLVAILLRYAEPLVTTVFGTNYLPAVVVLQAYAFVMIRSCFDFSPPLRAINRTRPLLFSNLLALIVNGTLLYFLVPRYGILGAMAAWIISGLFDGTYLAYAVANSYATTVLTLLPWKNALKVAACALLASAVIIAPFWVAKFGFLGVFMGSLLYCLTFVALLYWFRVAEALAIIRKFQKSFGAARA